MIQQNKTDQAVIDGQAYQQGEKQQVDPEVVNSQNLPHCQQHDQSKIQIVVQVSKTHDSPDEPILPMYLIQSQNHTQRLSSPMKQLKQSYHKSNINDISAVCIDLLSENDNTQKKCIINSLNQSPILPQLKKEDKVFMQQGIQTSGQLMLDRFVQQAIKENECTRPSRLPQFNQVRTSQLNTNIQIDYIPKCHNQQISEPPSAQIKEPKVIVSTQIHAQYPKVFLKQTLLDGQNKTVSQYDSSIKQTAYLNSLQASLPQIRNRIVTFQALQTHHDQNPSLHSLNQPQNEQDQETIRFLQGVDQNQYNTIITQLTQKLATLQLQYQQLVSQNDSNQSIQKVNQIQINPQKHPVQSQAEPQSHQQKLSICKNYQLSISLHQQKSKIPQQHNIAEQNQLEQPSSSKQAEVSDKRSQKIRQFSSGDVTNLLVQSQSQLIDLRDLQGPVRTPTNLNQLQQIPVVFSSSLSQQNSFQSTSPPLPVILLSQSHLATLKESYQELPYERIKNIMSLDFIILKISFKEKHYPSFCSTQKQLKLYGKRLLRLLFQNSPNASNQYKQINMLTLQNDLEYYKSQQHVVYYLKNNQNFVFVCYFNRTIYIGEYVTQGPIKQIIRQGYGIQIRQSKYIYQGDFFADKKHGYGFIEFIGKNSSLYCGSFLDGFMDGHGKSMNPNGEIYLGDYKLGQRDGLGKLIYNENKEAFYQGQFYDGFKHGKGYQLFDNGDSYKGSYVKDKFEGQGQYKWKNSTIYQGVFVEGSKHGPGLLIFASGQTLQKYYDHNKEINLEDDKKTIKSSRISSFSQNKFQQKTLIQQKPRNFRNTRSVSGQSLLSYKSKSNDKSAKLIKDKNKIAELLKQKQIQDDLRNLDKILKEPTDQNKIKKIFSVKKIDTRDKIIGKMYNTTQRPSIKLNDNGELDLIKLSKVGTQRKSLVNFDLEDKLEELRESTQQRRVQRTTNFSQF